MSFDNVSYSCTVFIIFISPLRGIPGAKRGALPFRKWYGNLGELRSLVPEQVKMIVATASATKETRAVIYESLQLPRDTAVVSKSPDRSNLHHSFQHINKDTPLELLFSDIIENVRSLGICAARTIIYCQTRKQCAVLYRVFQTCLGPNFYKDGSLPSNCKAHLVEMYHAGTPKTVKRHISKSLSERWLHKGTHFNYCIWYGCGLQGSEQSCAFWAIQKYRVLCTREWPCWKRWITLTVHIVIQWFPVLSFFS